MVSETDGRIDEVGQRLLADIGKLRRLEVSILEAEILRRLTDGRKTAFELIDAIYGLRRGDKGFNSARLKVRRALRSLERRGFVSTNLFGREKPYRLTRYGVAVLLPGAIAQNGLLWGSFVREQGQSVAGRRLLVAPRQKAL